MASPRFDSNGLGSARQESSQTAVILLTKLIILSLYHDQIE